MKIKFYSLIALSLLTQSVFSQSGNLPTKPAPSDSSTTKKEGTQGVGFGIMFGTDGVGASLGKCISKNGKLYIQLSGAYMGSSFEAIPYDFSGTEVLIDADLKLGSISAVLEYHPFGNSFKISTGVAYMLTDISAIAMVKDSAEQGDVKISPEEVGKINFDISTNPICPYIGIGFGRAVPRKRVAFNFEYGGYFINQPQLKFSTTGMLEPTSSQEGLIKSNLSGIKMLPTIKMGLIFKIGKLK